MMKMKMKVMMHDDTSSSSTNVAPFTKRLFLPHTHAQLVECIHTGDV